MSVNILEFKNKKVHFNRSMFETTPERSRLDGGGRRPVSEDLEKGLVSYQKKIRC